MEEIRKDSLTIQNISQSFQRTLEKEKQQMLLKQQMENYSNWRKKELKYMGKFLLIHNFLEHDLKD